MREGAAQAVLLARAIEEADAEGVLLRAEDRRAATDRARAAGGTVEEQAATRAETLLASVESEVPGLARARRFTRIGLGLTIPVALIAFFVGLLSNALGHQHQVNILSFPLLTLLAWNLGIYALLIAEAVLGHSHKLAKADAPSVAAEAAGHGADSAAAREHGTAVVSPRHDGDAAHDGAAEIVAPAGRLRGLAAALGAWLAEVGLSRVSVRDRRLAGLVTRALGSFARTWLRLSAALTVARLRLLLHFGAAFLAVGAVAGMYLRGLTSEYRATWESTFVGPETVGALLGLVLGPAAWLLGVSLPDVAELARMRAPASAGPAAIWIHLWALTAAIVVVVPRLLLAATEFVRQARLAANLPVSPTAGSFRALLAPDRGAGTWLQVLPYSLRLSRRQLELLHELLHDLFGLRAEVRVAPTVEYGADASDVEQREPNDDLPECAVVVFASVQSPEHEVHARFVEEVMARGTPGHGSQRVLVLVDGSAWRERLGAARDDRRLAERRRAWDRVLREIGLAPLHIDLDGEVDAEVVEEAEGRIWPAAISAAERRRSAAER